jgi:hypothetical protein
MYRLKTVFSEEKGINDDAYRVSKVALNLVLLKCTRISSANSQHRVNSFPLCVSVCVFVCSTCTTITNAGSVGVGV